MKKISLLALLFSVVAHADFVYMKENGDAKSIQLQTEGHGPITLSDISNEQMALYPDITPDGSEIVYVEGPTHTDMHLVYLNKTTGITQKFYLETKGLLIHPKFSKNARFIFYSAPGSNGKHNIFYFNREEEVKKQGDNLTYYSLKNAKNLTPDEDAYHPRPSSDGNFVIYQRNMPGKKEIVLFDRVEGKKTILAEGMSPALSFDETLIAYTSKVSGVWDIYILNRTNNEVQRMTFGKGDKTAPTFKPDNTLVFASNKFGPYQIFELQKDGEWKKLVHLPENDPSSVYSPKFSGEKKYLQGSRAPYIGEARSSFGTVSHNGKIYMAGGHQGAEHTYPPESFSNQFVAYDIETNSWTNLAPRPALAHGYQIAAKGNYIYAFGGFAYSENHKPKWTSLDSIDRYNIALDKWERIGTLQSKRSSNVAVTFEDKVYLAAGWDSTPKFDNDYDGTFLDTIEVFDLTTEKLTVAPYKLPYPKRRALTGIGHEGKMILVGGISEGASHFDLLTKVTSINLVTGEVSEMTPLPFGTFAPAADILNGELMVFGGMFKTGPQNYEYVSHIYAMDLMMKKWRHTGRALQETKGFSQVFKVNESELGILGGHRYFEGEDSPVKTFETISVKN